MELRLTPEPNNVYQRHAIESINAGKTPTTDGIVGDYDFAVTQMFMYIPRMEGEMIIDKKEYIIDLNEIRLQKNEITGANSQFSLDVSPSTHALTVAFQDEAAGSDTLRSITKFKIRDDLELKLEELYVRYGGIQKPQPPFDLSFNSAANKDLIVELYGRNLLHLGGYYDSSAETLEEWRERGFYVHFPWPKTGDDRETRVYVLPKFNSDAFAAAGRTPRLLLFNWYKKIAIIRMDNGRVIEVMLSDV